MWKTVKLGDLCETVTKGTTPTSVGFKFTSEGINFVKIESLAADSTFITSKFAKINSECHEALKRSQLKEGDILFSIAGALGRTAIVTKDVLPSNTNQALAIVRLKENIEVDKRFLLYVLNSESTKEQSDSNKGGVAQQNLSLTQLKNYEISLPPLAEQQRIVAKLDAAFAEIDRAKDIEALCLENSKAIINSTLNELFIAEGKQWHVVPLAETCIIERGSSPRPIKLFLTDNDGVNWIKIGDTDKDGKYVRGTKEKITFEGAKKSRPVRKGDFILTNSMSYGRPYIMDIDGCIHDGWFALRLNENIDTEYYYYLLASPYVQNQFHTLAAGAVVKNISSDLVKRAMLPMPPLARQIEIRNRILAIEMHTQELASCHRAKIQHLSQLKAAILAQELKPPHSEAA